MNLWDSFSATHITGENRFVFRTCGCELCETFIPDCPTEINDFSGVCSEWGNSNARSLDSKLTDNTFSNRF